MSRFNHKINADMSKHIDRIHIGGGGILEGDTRGY